MNRNFCAIPYLREEYSTLGRGPAPPRLQIDANYRSTPYWITLDPRPIGARKNMLKSTINFAALALLLLAATATLADRCEPGVPYQESCTCTNSPPMTIACQEWRDDFNALCSVTCEPCPCIPNFTDPKKRIKFDPTKGIQTPVTKKTDPKK